MLRQQFLWILFATSVFSITAYSQEEAVITYVKLSPAGSFEARTNNVQGFAKKNGNGFVANNISVDLNSLKTKMDLRDEHMKEKYLDTKKHPKAELISAEGSNGKGTGRIKIRGIEKPISGTYELIADGKKLKAEFELMLSDFGITGIKYMGVGVKDKVKLNVTVPIQ